MSGDKASSSDSAVIDDDLVEALGFEPLATDLEEGSADTAQEALDSSVITIDGSDIGEDADGSSESPEERRGGAVVLGDVTPVDADDPVTADIAAVVFGDSSDVEDTADAGDLDSAVTASSENSDAETDGDALAVAADSASDSDDFEETPERPLFTSTSRKSEEAASGSSDEEIEARADDVDESSETKADNAKESERLDSVDSELLIDLVDPAEAESAFPDVPLVEDGIDFDLDADVMGRELLTQPVERADALVSDIDVITEIDTAPGAGDALETQPETATTISSATKSQAVPTGYRRKRVRAKKSRRVIRHIDPWSVLTFSVLFHLALYTAFLLASVLVWQTLDQSGVVDNLEDFIIALGDYETYEINADVLFRVAVVVTGILTVASTIMSVLLCVVFNLISDLVGGIRVTVLEEETVRLPAKKKSRKTK